LLEHAELSTQQAAGPLNVSAPLSRAADRRGQAAGAQGRHAPRVLLSDLLAYTRRDDAHRETVMQELAGEAQALGLGY